MPDAALSPLRLPIMLTGCKACKRAEQLSPIVYNGGSRAARDRIETTRAVFTIAVPTWFSRLVRHQLFHRPELHVLAHQPRAAAN